MSLPRPVDLEHLCRYTGGDANTNADVLGLFADHCTGLLKQLESVVADKDSKGWRETVHALKGGARGIGAFGLGDMAAAAEAVDPAVNPDAAKRMLHDLKTRALAVTLFIEAYLGH